jgi:NAD(P)-dependent dehydrogenase (short-subunit alcohol dehydrogenase family)
MQTKLQTVLITGGTSGLGCAAAELLALKGYRVFAGGRSSSRREELGRFARDNSLSIQPIELDVCDDDSVSHAVAEIERRAGAVDILINNAGIAYGATMEEISLADLRKQFETNFFGVLRVTKRVLPGMRQRQRGRIINMSSISGRIAIPIMGSYASSKFALEAVSDSMRLELHPFGIRVILIEPGYIATNMNHTAEELSSAYITGAEKSPYAGVYRSFLDSWEKERKTSRYVPADCARVVLGAIEDKRPRARYVVTRPAKLAILLKRILPEAAFDWALRRELRLDELRASLETEIAP